MAKKPKADPIHIFPEELRDQIDKITEEGIDTHYTVFTIPKRSKGVRTICAPSPELKAVQRAILRNLNPLLWLLPSSAQGFLPNKNLVTNALKHRGSAKTAVTSILKHGLSSVGRIVKQYSKDIRGEFVFIDSGSNRKEIEAAKYVVPKSMIRVDLKDAFGSISAPVTKGALVKFLKTSLFNPDPLEDIEKIIEICTLNGSLPQGAPTSPALLNIALIDFDEYLLATLTKVISKPYKTYVKYTRYADDLVISCTKPYIAQKAIPIVRGVCSHFGLRVNEKKTKIMSPSTGLFVTGINIVNSATHLSVSRKSRHKIRAAIFKASNETDPVVIAKARAKIIGRLSQVYFIDSIHGIRLMRYGLKRGILRTDDKIGGELVYSLMSLSLNATKLRTKIFSTNE
jgi:hypothetical protein